MRLDKVELAAHLGTLPCARLQGALASPQVGHEVGDALLATRMPRGLAREPQVEVTDQMIDRAGGVMLRLASGLLRHHVGQAADGLIAAGKTLLQLALLSLDLG